MPTLSPARVYRSDAGEIAVRSWCEQELGRARDLSSLGAVVADGRPTRVHTMPGGPATPVLLLSGAFLGSANLIGAARVLAADRPVLMADLPGLPGTSDSRRPSRPIGYGDWLDALLPLVTSDPVIVLGHSTGAAAALTALPSPLVAGMLLVNPAGLAAPASDAEYMRASLAWRISPTWRAGSRLLDTLSAPRPAGSGSHPLTGWATLVGRHCRSCPVPGLLRGEDFRDWTGKPVVVATGAHDRLMTPALLGSPARRLLGTDVHVIEDAGHLAPYEAPERVRDLLREVDRG
ncbi:alpha/beta fold hydrolase [Nocardiopsis algeriensis]|uniref:Pimeloyl-ACP methyl ester carboxylesterase n=1 Tax=Nocardiopsis algeriensis TaxID=1478215 RepID=A0A841IS36_9ACTN|nr:alpha/beta hydrolase [Nocardiopsis algeriensis]MBB6121497.1 pimeloyl-ACP methyl ester carboxylesterase [Nocardiopsis algeriensis]